MKTPEDALDRDAVTRYVLSRQTPEGGYSYYRTPQWGVEEPNAPDTLAALGALQLLGIDPPRSSATLTWLRALQDEQGGFPSFVIGWAALRAIDLLGAAPTRSPLAWLESVWRSPLRGDVKRDWRGVLLDGLRFVELSQLCRSELSGEKTSQLGGLIEVSSEPNGGWARPGPDLETTAIALRLAVLVGAAVSRVSGAAVGFVRHCEDDVLGFRLSPGARATAVAALWGGLDILHFVGESPRRPRTVAMNLVLCQRPNGGIGARHRAIATLQATWQCLEANDLLTRSKET